MSPQGVTTIKKYDGEWGKIFGPRSYYSPVDIPWCMDNDAFNTGFNADAFFGFLEKMLPYISLCKFVAVPDVVANAVATMDNYRWWAWKVKAMGYPVAFVAQDGQESYKMPPEYDALFIGGSTEWKLSAHVDKLILKAKSDRKWVHVGRVNSQKRIRHFQLVGVDSVDGTTVAIAPDENYPKMRVAIEQPPLFRIGD